MTLREAYRVFDLPPTAQWTHIKQAYRRRAWQSHPDRFGHGTAAYYAAEERFKRVNQAYERLRAAGKQHRGQAKSMSTSPPASNAWHTAQRRTVRSPAAAASPVDATSTNPSAAPSCVHAANPLAGLPTGWMRILSVTGSVAVFCLGVLWSSSLAAMLAWTASWIVFTVGTYSLCAGSRA